MTDKNRVRNIGKRLPKKKDGPYAKPPPGGRALERIRQDRLARGLDAPPKANQLTLEDSTERRKS